MTFQFLGTTSESVDLDPSEYTGQSVPQIAGEIEKVLRDIAPGVSFDPIGIATAATDLYVQSNKATCSDCGTEYLVGHWCPAAMYEELGGEAG